MAAIVVALVVNALPYGSPPESATLREPLPPETPDESAGARASGRQESLGQPTTMR
jgi:hypothetical protein